MRDAIPVYILKSLIKENNYQNVCIILKSLTALCLANKLTTKYVQFVFVLLLFSLSLFNGMWSSQTMNNSYVFEVDSSQRNKFVEEFVAYPASECGV